MIQSIQRGMIVEMLLNSLEAERYVRGPLLHNVVDELSANDAFAPAAAMARELLSAIERGPVTEATFHARLGELRSCVRTLARTTPRLVSGSPANAA